MKKLLTSLGIVLISLITNGQSELVGYWKLNKMTEDKFVVYDKVTSDSVLTSNYIKTITELNDTILLSTKDSLMIIDFFIQARNIADSVYIEIDDELHFNACFIKALSKPSTIRISGNIELKENPNSILFNKGYGEPYQSEYILKDKTLVLSFSRMGKLEFEKK